MDERRRSMTYKTTPEGELTMGYAQYTVIRNGEQIEAGYAVEAVCEREDCTTEIDRGLGYLCGEAPGGDEHGCGGYFCESHLLGGNQCTACVDRIEQERLDEFAGLLAEALEQLAEVKSAGAEDGKPRVFVELADGFEIVVSLGTGSMAELVSAPVAGSTNLLDE
jgi:hypothetical protein